MDETALVSRYFSAFNANDATAMAEMVSEDVEHRPNEGEVRRGKAAFVDFLSEMDRAYTERAEDLTLFEGPSGRVAAEFTIHGKYLATQEGLPEATGQTYVLPVGSFFEIADGKITRVTTFYNLSDWLAQVGA